MTLTRFLYHITTNPETPEDSVHYFRDDNGRWVAYAFDDKLVACAPPPPPPPLQQHQQQQQQPNSSSIGLAGASAIAASPLAVRLAAAAAAASSQPTANKQNDKLLNTLLREHISQNLFYDGSGGYDLVDLPDLNLSSNSYSSLSLNSAGTCSIVVVVVQLAR